MNGHMIKHNESTGHPLALCLRDLSVWCYPCKSYIDHKVRNRVNDATNSIGFSIDNQFVVYSYVPGLQSGQGQAIQRKVRSATERYGK